MPTSTIGTVTIGVVRRWLRDGLVSGKRALLGVAAGALLLAAVTGCAHEEDVTVLRLGHGMDPTHPVHQAMVFMSARASTLSGGSLQVRIYPSQQLGTERECLELLQIGSLAMTKVSASVLENFAPRYRVFGVPFLFESEAHRFAALDGPVGDTLLASSTPFRLRGLTFYDAGSRSFYTKDRPIHSPEDLAGLKIRTQESATAMRMVGALGGSATPISWGELYTALQQGVVDGAENNPPSFYLSRHYEVARYFTLNEHTGVPDVLMMSEPIWQGLSPQERAWLEQAADESAVLQRRLWRESTEQAIAAVEAAGGTVIRPDKAPFRERVAAMVEGARRDPLLAPLIDGIDAAADPSSP